MAGRRVQGPRRRYLHDLDRREVRTALFATGNANTSTTISYEDVALLKPS